MLKIRVRDMDALERLLDEMGIYIYFEGLLQADRATDVLGEERMQWVWRSAENYLWERQRETLLQIKTLVEGDAFTRSEYAART